MTISVSVAQAELNLNGHGFNNFIAGDYLELTPVNAPSNRVNGSDERVVISNRVDGNVFDLTLRVMSNSEDDIFLNSAIQTQTVTIFNGSLKRSFVTMDASGNDLNGVDTHILSSGSMTQNPTSAYNNQDGNEVREYKIQFRTVQRQI